MLRLCSSRLNNFLINSPWHQNKTKKLIHSIVSDFFLPLHCDWTLKFLLPNPSSISLLITTKPAPYTNIYITKRNNYPLNSFLSLADCCVKPNQYSFPCIVLPQCMSPILKALPFPFLILMSCSWTEICSVRHHTPLRASPCLNQLRTFNK